MCKVTWCNKVDRYFKNGNPKPYCSTHKNPIPNSQSRPWLFYKREKILENKLECEHCGDHYPTKYPKVDIKILISLLDVDHIDNSIKGKPEGEQPSNYQLLCKVCHVIKSHKEGDYNSNKNKYE
jgi:5-methylcytosine-specific restriction endonuclease McrA